jgi:hypothetical protein
MSWEKSIADKLTGFFGKAKSVETKVINDIKQVEKFVIGEAKGAFDKAHTDAVAANVEVNKLKADLQSALNKATQLHQAAIDAANSARAAAEADVLKFASLASAHAADLATQASQIIAPPPAPAPVVEAPAPADPAPVTAAELSGDGVTATVTPADPAAPAQ